MVEIPPGILTSLQQIFLQTAARNALLYHDLAQVLTTLQSAGIKVAVLKGAHLAALIYPHPGLRPMADIDLLVPEDKLELTHQLLLTLGYTPRPTPGRDRFHPGPHNLLRFGNDSSPSPVGTGSTPVPDPRLPAPPAAPACGPAQSAVVPESAGNPHSALPKAKHLPPYDKPPHPRIEIHWTIEDTYIPMALDAVQIHSRLRPAAVAGVPTHVLSPEDLVLYQCTHLAGHRFSCHGLRPLADLTATLQHHKTDLDWSVIHTRAREWQAQLYVYLALRLAHELLQAPLLPGFLEQLRPADFDDRFCDLARESLCEPHSGSDDGGRVDTLTEGLSRRSLGSRIAYLLRTAFPSREYMAAYTARHHSLCNGRRSYSAACVTRLLDLSVRGLRFLWHSRRKLPDTRQHIARMKRRAQLWRYLRDHNSTRRA